MLAHTIADHETPAERRTVIELAQRYVRERGIAVGRFFTISALEYFEATQHGRAPAGWNELGALRETLASHAEAHMQRLVERERAAGPQPARSSTPAAQAAGSRHKLYRALDRLLGRRER